MASLAFRTESGTLLQPNLRTSVADERDLLPILDGRHVALRAVRASDAESLHSVLTTPEVSRFISAPPATVEGFERFLARANRQPTGRYLCYAVTLKGSDVAIGMFKIREIE